MNSESLARTWLGQIFIRIIAVIMESRLRYRFFGPKKILEGAEIGPGQKVLEIGCGTGFFTLNAAKMIGDQGSLLSMDMLSISVETVLEKVKKTKLKNVRVIKGDAINTHLDDESFDKIIIFGVIPAPMLPMEKLMAEMHRILRPGGIMSIWPPSWVHQSILQSRLFTYSSKRNNVLNYMRR
jgi:ubiquinone/menaquinone biosynthesis C-methylase UbiE